MERTIAILRFKLDQQWSATNFGQFYASIAHLYNVRLLLERLHEEQRYWPLEYRNARLSRQSLLLRRPWLPSPAELEEPQFTDLLEPGERLEVLRIKYSSPGLTDVAGIGVIVGHLKDFVLKIIDRADSRRSRQLADDRSFLENQRLAIENAQAFAALASDLGYSEAEKRRLILDVDARQNIIAALVDEGKITKALIRSDEP